MLLFLIRIANTKQIFKKVLLMQIAKKHQVKKKLQVD